MIEDNPSIDRTALLALLHREWRVKAGAIEFLPVGGSSWSYRVGEWFVNVKPADDRRAHWDMPRNVGQSFAVAAALRERCGLDFLLAPTPTESGDATGRLGRFLVVVTPFVEGVVRGWEPFARNELQQAVEWVGRIHAATPAVADLPLDARTFEVQFSSALREAVLRTFGDGRAIALARRLRELVLPYRDALAASLAEHESLARVLRERRYDFVVTHGEPDPQNVLESSSGKRWLIDLGEIALAPRELDLYVLRKAARPEDAEVVPELDPDLARYYDGRWNLSEITEYLDHLSRSDGAEVPDDTSWNWRVEPEPEWRTEGERAWGLLRYFLGVHLGET